MCLSVTNDIQEQVNSARRTVRRVAFAAFWQRRCSGELQNFSNSDNRHTHGKIDTEPLHEATRSPPNHPVHKARNLLHPRGAGGTFDGFLALGDSSEVRNFGYINNNEKFSSLQHRGGRVVYGAGFKRLGIKTKTPVEQSARVRTASTVPYLFFSNLRTWSNEYDLHRRFFWYKPPGSDCQVVLSLYSQLRALKPPRCCVEASR